MCLLFPLSLRPRREGTKREARARALPAVVTSSARDLSAVCTAYATGIRCTCGSRERERDGDGDGDRVRAREREIEKGQKRKAKKKKNKMLTYICMYKEKVGIFGFIKIVLRDACTAGLIIIIIMTTVYVFTVQAVYTAAEHYICKILYVSYTRIYYYYMVNFSLEATTESLAARRGFL